MNDYFKRPSGKNATSHAAPILKARILQAQDATRSNAEAARWLGVSYPTYKKYATLYGIFDNHLNQAGNSLYKPKTRAFHSGKKIPLLDIFAGKHPKYNLILLRNRLIARRLRDPKCDMCGFSEMRASDNDCPLVIARKDGDDTNWKLDNLVLRCYNCAFLTSKSGLLQKVHGTFARKSLQYPEFRAGYSKHITISAADYMKPKGEPPLSKLEEAEEANLEFSDDELDDLLDEVDGDVY